MRGRCDEELLVAYVAGGLSASAAEAVSEHVRQCSVCAWYLNSLTGLTEAMKSPSVWLQMSTTAARRKEINDQAKDLAPELLGNPPSQWRSILDIDHRFLTSGVVREVIARADRSYDKHPDRALELASLASDIADRLTEDDPTVIDEVRMEAWQTRGIALMCLGRYLEAVGALDRAAASVTALPDSDLRLALLDYTRADVYRQIGRYAEGLTVIRAATAKFLEYGDTRRYVRARQVEAAILYRSGAEPGDSVSIFRDVVGHALQLGDAETTGVTLAALGQSLYFAGEFDEAEECFAEATRHLSKVGNRDGALLKIELGRARLLVSRGRKSEAIDTYRDIRDEFARLAMLGDWVYVSVELVELLLDLGEHEEVLRLCSRIVAKAREAGMQPAVVEAVGFMRVAAKAGSLTIDRASYVRKYLDALPSHPGMRFDPPAV